MKEEIPSNIEPTKSELEILQVLWQHGPSTVRFVNDTLNEQKREVQYTSTLKLMQIMTEKGLVARDESDRTHIYHPRLTQEQTQRQLVRDLLDRAFGGSSSKLVMQALATRRASAEELMEIRQLLDDRPSDRAQHGDGPDGTRLDGIGLDGESDGENNDERD